MNRTEPFLRPHLDNFIEFRKASERFNQIDHYNLLRFEKSCYEQGENHLTQDMVDSWCAKRESENYNSQYKRIISVHNFIKYLNERNLSTIRPPALPKMVKNTYLPHSFTKEELSLFFKACDSIEVIQPNHLYSIVNKLTIPVIFRLLYSTGMRTCEARRLRKSDVNLENGVINIRYSKGFNQHYVIMHPSMLELMKRFDKKISGYFPDREYFFPTSRPKQRKYFSNRWLCQNFEKCWKKVSSQPCRAYDLRHHYAIQNINKLLDQGFDFDDKLVYLSKTMGHSSLEATRSYYSITPALAGILEEKCSEGLDWLLEDLDL